MNRTFKIGGGNVRGFSEIVNDGTMNGGHCQFGGVGSYLNQDLIDMITKQGIGCTISKEMQQDRTLTHSDYIAALQIGEYDWFTDTYSYTDLPDDGVLASPILNEETMTILSYYNLSTNPREGNVLSMFTAVPYVLWIGYILSFFVFVSVAYFASYIMKSPKYCSFWNTISAFLDQNNFPADTLFVSTLSAVVSMAMFFLLTYATNSMGTDMVTIEDPIVIKSYDDIIDRNITNSMLPAISEWGSFAHAKEGSKEWKIFKNTGNYYHPKNNLSMTTAERFFTQKQVLISRESVVRIIGHQLIMTPANEFDKIKGRLLLSVDTDAKRYTKVMAYSARWKGTVVEDIFKKFLRHIIEHGLFVHYLDAVPSMFIRLLFGDSNSPSNRRLMSRTVETFGGKVQSIGWKHFRPVLFNLVVGFILPLIGLAYEIARRRAESKVRRKRRPKHAKRIITID